jgi:hypothetical protein
MTTANEVCDWLKKNSVHPITECRPVKVTIGKKSYVGAFYTTEELYSPTERAVTEGRVTANDKNVDHKFYLIGDRPKLRKAHHCFQWASGIALDERVYRHTDEWYVCCHSSEAPQSQIPWKMFMLSEWRSHAYGYYENHKIDTLEQFKYERAPMAVEYL